jgi:hypothetical protein
MKLTRSALHGACWTARSVFDPCVSLLRGRAAVACDGTPESSDGVAGTPQKIACANDSICYGLGMRESLIQSTFRASEQNEASGDEPQTDQRATQRHEGLVDLRQPVPTQPRPTELMRPGQRPLDEPSEHPQATAMSGPTPRQHRPDPTPTQLPAVRLRVVGPIPWQPARPASRPAAPAPHRRYGVHQRPELGHVMAVRPRQGPRQRDAPAIGQDVALAAQLPAIRGVRAGLRAPARGANARTVDPGTRPVDPSAPCNSAGRTSCSFCQTPERCQRRR